MRTHVPVFPPPLETQAWNENDKGDVGMRRLKKKGGWKHRFWMISPLARAHEEVQEQIRPLRPRLPCAGDGHGGAVPGGTRAVGLSTRKVQRGLVAIGARNAGYRAD